MTDRGSDIDFDFFEEPETQEAPARTRGVRRAPRPPVRPPGGLTPLLRLVGLVAFAVAAVVVLVFAVQSCRSESKRERYVTYMDDVRAIARDSEQVGRQLSGVLTARGIEQGEIQTRLGGLADQQEQDAGRALELSPPGHLREQHRQLVGALELRASGLRRLQDAFRRSAGLRNAREAGTLLAEQMRRFVASDVLWEDGFRQGSVEVLREQGVTGVDVPASNFLADPELATARAMAPVWQRIRGAARGRPAPGPHGNALVSVRVLPGGDALSPDQENRIVASADLAFEATIENSGESQEVQVKVRLTIDQRPRPIRQTQTVNVIDPGQRKTVTFRNLGQIVQFGDRVPVRVEVLPVPGEENTANNAATYPVTFVLE